MADREADLGADLQELQANRLTLSASQGGLLQSETTQGVHEHVGGGGQIQPELIGAHRCRAGPVGEQTQLLFFYAWVSRANARDEWIARTSDDQIIVNILACKLALVTRAHDFLTSTDSAVFLRGARAFTLQHPPVQRVADVSEQIESLSDLSDEQLEKMEAVRDAARLENAKGKDKEMSGVIK